jgi:phytoene dehydrogenase-like protein
LTRGLPEVDRSPTTRTRRWDAVILGGALPGLVAAARLGMRGARVLVLEEEAALGRFAGLREPFWISGAHKQGVLGACLRALSVPLIDQRRVEPDPLAFQVTLPDARLDVGEPGLAVDEWVAWGRARPDEARNLVRACSEAATAVRDAMLESPVVHAPRRLARAPRRPAERDGASPAPSPRELAATVAAAPPRLAALLAAQVRTLSNLGVAEPGPAARARLLGAPFRARAGRSRAAARRPL